MKAMALTAWMLITYTTFPFWEYQRVCYGHEGTKSRICSGQAEKHSSDSSLHRCTAQYEDFESTVNMRSPCEG